jgi:hypothetical protein
MERGAGRIALRKKGERGSKFASAIIEQFFAVIADRNLEVRHFCIPFQFYD